MKKWILLFTLSLLKFNVNAQNNEKIYQEFEAARNAEYPGGINAFRKELMQNIIYPFIAQKNRTQGRVIMQFTVDKEGSIIDIKILRDIGDGCGEASVEALKKITTKWQPALNKDGEPVKVRRTIPVEFKLNEDKEDLPILGIFKDSTIHPDYKDKINFEYLNTKDFYYDCANYVHVKGISNPSFKVLNGFYIESSDEKDSSFVEYRKKMMKNSNEKIVLFSVYESLTGGENLTIINTYSNEKLADRRKIKMKKVPNPRVGLFVNNKEIDTLKGIKAQDLKKLTLKIIPDADFAKNFPKEIKYTIESFYYILKDKNNNIPMDLNRTTQKAKKGDILEIQVNGIKRVNFRGRVLPANVSNPVINTPIL